jgi:hypothetical protein
MDLKTVVVAVTKINDNEFSFNMPVGAPFGECYDACFQTLNKITELMKEAAEKAKPISAEAETSDNSTN